MIQGSGFDPAALSKLAAEMLTRRANPAKAVPMAAYMKTDMPFYGVQKAGRTEVFREIRRRFSPPDQERYEAGVLALWNGMYREEKYLGIEFARGFKSFIVPASLGLYEHLIREGAWWDLVDPVAADLVGRVLLEHRSEVSPVMEEWVHDGHLWIRRTAIISQLRHKHQTDAEQLFRFCLDRAQEKDFFIRKAIGWALREYSKTAPSAAQTFLEAHRASLSVLSFREGMKVLNRAKARSE